MSTVKDTRDNIETFVTRNLASGADHMVVFVDAADNEPEDSEPPPLDHVTFVRTDTGYWAGQRPSLLNARQRVNADVALTALALFDEVEWLFHLDGDECLDIDTDVLAQVPTDISCVRLNTFEAVSRRVWDTDVRWFKRPLAYDELCLAHALGLIAAPSNGEWFNGHTAGKPGVRPSIDICLDIHRPTDRARRELAAFRDPALNVLHYESYSEAEFVRKWEAHLSSGGAAFRVEKDRIRAAVSAVVTNPLLPDDRKRELMSEIYRRFVEDELDLSRELGYLVERAVGDRHRSPPAVDPTVIARMRAVLATLYGVDKRRYGCTADGQPSPTERLPPLPAAPASAFPDLEQRRRAALEPRRPPTIVPSADEVTEGLARDL